MRVVEINEVAMIFSISKESTDVRLLIELVGERKRKWLRGQQKELEVVKGRD